MNGTVDVEKELENWTKKLNDAGVQDVIAEKQKQLDEWLAAQVNFSICILAADRGTHRLAVHKTAAGHKENGAAAGALWPWKDGRMIPCIPRLYKNREEQHG